MNWDHIEGNWKQFTGAAKEKWGRFTHDELERIAGKRDVLTSKVQECYGLTRKDAERQVSDWEGAQAAKETK